MTFAVGLFGACVVRLRDQSWRVDFTFLSAVAFAVLAVFTAAEAFVLAVLASAAAVFAVVTAVEAFVLAVFAVLRPSMRPMLRCWRS